MSKRTSSPTPIANKKIKVTAAGFRLLDLPLEILDTILLHALELVPSADFFNDGLASSKMAIAVSWTCRLLRSRVRCIVKSSCVWIRIGCDVEQLRKKLFNQMRMQKLPVVTLRYRRLLDQSTPLPTISLFIGSRLLVSVDEQKIWSPMRSVMLPWSHRTWLRIAELVTCHQEIYSDHRPPRITLHCDTPFVSIGYILNTYVIPAFLTAPQPGQTRFMGKILLKTLETVPQKQIGDLTASRITSAKYIFNEIKAVYCRMTMFEKEGNLEDAELVANYSHEYVKNSLPRLPPVSHSDTGLFNHDDVYNFGARRLAIEIHYKTVLLLKRWYRRWGLRWIEKNQHELRGLKGFAPQYYARNQLMPIMLRSKERSKYHLSIADALEIKYRMWRKLESHQDDAQIRSVGEETNVSEIMLEAHSQRTISSRLLLGPQGCLSDTQNSGATQNTPRVDKHYIELHNAGSTGYFWAGDKRLVSGAQGRECLAYYLRHTQEIAVAMQGLLNDVTDGNPEEDVQHCGQACNCIVF